MNSVPLTGSPPIADRGGLAETLLGGLEHRLIGQRARSRHDADTAGLEDVGRHDADLAFAGGHHAGQFGPISRDFDPDSERLTRTMSSTGMPSVMQTISGIFGVDGFADRIRRPGGGT